MKDYTYKFKNSLKDTDNAYGFSEKLEILKHIVKNEMNPFFSDKEDVAIVKKYINPITVFCYYKIGDKKDDTLNRFFDNVTYNINDLLKRTEDLNTLHKPMFILYIRDVNDSINTRVTLPRAIQLYSKVRNLEVSGKLSYLLGISFENPSKFTSLYYSFINAIGFNVNYGKTADIFESFKDKFEMTYPLENVNVNVKGHF